jgi:ABC-type oligopeptide transport system ATPase subunit
MSDTHKPLLQVDGLTKVYPARRDRAEIRAVDDVSFSIAPGETLGLVGESGSGKTTLGRLLLRLVEPTAGRVEMSVPGEPTVDLMQLTARQLRLFRRHAQMIFHDPYTSLNPRMTVGEIVAEPLWVHQVVPSSELDTEVRELFGLVGLRDAHRDQLPSALSGGQRQRVGIARAIATRPKLIVADEPVTALDVSIQAQILNLLRDLQEQLGLSYLFISHDLAVVEHMARRIAVMSRGLLVETGEMSQLLANPTHPSTKRLIEATRASA